MRDSCDKIETEDVLGLITAFVYYGEHLFDKINSVQNFSPITLILRRFNVIYHHWVRTLIYRLLSYPLRSLHCLCLRDEILYNL